uniref:Tubulin-specific chaperone cofactor E-like protein n=1 Tax=Trichobilharzia regenti TaxID=157069 RepID=A0AA85J6R7_TRIRE|nr:unnamed protein product [Trichobilharzia regenti]
MTTLVEAIQKKHEKLTESHIFVGHIQKACNRSGENILFPAWTLTMDCENIDKIGRRDELLKEAEHVRELDLAGNLLSSFEEVFKLLCWLKHLESLNLSQNPLGPHSSNHQSSNSSFDEDAVGLSLEENIQPVNSECIHGLNSICCEKSSELNNNNITNNNSNNVLRLKQNENHFSSVFQNDSLSDALRKLKSSNYRNGDYSKQTTENESPSMKVLLKHLATPSEIALNSGIISSSTLFPRLSVLALNSTFIPWDWVLDLLSRLPNLTDLHVARNNYGADENNSNDSGNSSINNDDNEPLPVFPHLQSLYYSDNGISNWLTICRLCRHFPGLEQLILLGNPIEYIPVPEKANQSMNAVTTVTTPSEEISEDKQELSTNNNNPYHDQCLFENVHTLGLSETLISQWESIDALDEWMPNLKNLRLGNTLPVFQSWMEPDCRAHVIARLPKLTTYNRSVIDSEERESAEREFVRYYGQIDPDQRPNRYWDLERQHGRLEPLANIDLSPKQYIRVRVSMCGKEVWYNLNVNLKVCQAKRHFSNLFNIPQTECRRFKLFYFDQVMSQIQGPEELKYPNRNLYSYQLEPGDLFELVRSPDYSKR